jgi:hypothetical protein
LAEEMAERHAWCKLIRADGWRHPASRHISSAHMRQ